MGGFINFLYTMLKKKPQGLLAQLNQHFLMCTQSKATRFVQCNFDCSYFDNNRKIQNNFVSVYKPTFGFHSFYVLVCYNHLLNYSNSNCYRQFFISFFLIDRFPIIYIYVNSNTLIFQGWFLLSLVIIMSGVVFRGTTYPTRVKWN